jgi:hypothetical protein
MKINTQKIRSEMARTGLSYEAVGKLFDPPRTRKAVWYVIHRAKTISVINEIARVLDLDPKDLII